LLDRHFKSDHGGERKNLDIYNFAAWMFNEYLFGIKNQHPFFTSKHLRKAAYQFLIKMCGYTDVLKTIAQSIRSLMKGFKDSNEVEGEIRSRNLEFNGIKNLGATCYINSLIQQLYHTAFPAILLEDENDPSSKDDIKLLQLKKIFANLYCGIRSPVYPNDYVDSVKINGEVVRPMVQQDVNEFFASLMHEVEQTVGSRALNETICGTLCHEIRGLEEGS
jgi:ubiquitin C-terminal hydrolase